jgi:hypothetical protein
MKILVLIVSDKMDKEYTYNIESLNKYLLDSTVPNMYDTKTIHVDYCGISSYDDFSNYEGIIHFKYKMINPKKQLSKVCDFITTYYNKGVLEYDWYIKVRPDIKLLEPINFNVMLETAINARTRVYKGPKRVKYGSTVNGEGPWKNIIGSCYNNIETEIILDDQIYICHNNILKKGAFNYIDGTTREDEWYHTTIWKSRNIPLNIIGINTIILKYNAISGHVNM